MALAVTVIDKYFDGKRGHMVIGVTASGNYATGGDTLNLAGLMPGAGTLPTWVELQGINGFIYAYAAGTTQQNGKVKVFVEGTVSANAPLIEHTAAAYVAGVTSDTITGYVEFKVR